MSYALVSIWFLSNLLCIYLAKQRGLQPGVIARVVGAFLGPLAIPLIYLSKPLSKNESH